MKTRFVILGFWGVDMLMKKRHILLELARDLNLPVSCIKQLCGLLGLSCRTASRPGQHNQTKKTSAVA